MSTRELLVSGRRAHAAAGPLAVAGPWAMVPHLARVQARRVARHPALLLGVLWYVLGVGLGGAEDAVRPVLGRDRDRSCSCWPCRPTSR